ncbi:general secretion pathway protein H|uniref:Type II secretion system protein H n=1 Tax=Brenneria salicis ATCC 15712 = DSM 30166 TaxID=714314 RepID=A0A366I9E1_9GAMM|nr:type II secretion system minor pseudopilin GspH [Brenneria salicis]NMN91002.1 general secretion pathway protein H [Brenneria salicis ATCC 15712 = DSM 30166]RBP66496.1 general secretion pathway protein H [Brenneria salicis ATCC 15712 = DSM 30166]RLM32051.1 type II secretion system protein GspH [Brenneria salicis ATCC 15712 = DSM 30166]
MTTTRSTRRYQRGFTLLEMMLVVLLAGVAATLVVMAFPAERQNDSAWQLARFQTQLAFAADASQINELMLGVRIYPDRWQFYQLQRETSSETESDANWKGYQWRPWRPYRVNPSATMPDSLRFELLQVNGKKAQKRRGKDNDAPDILILPGGEITPFRLLLKAEDKSLSNWLEVDGNGMMRTSFKQAEIP